jgi:large subunit ribosomal protein L17
MKHRVAGRRLDRTTEHRTAMFRNMVTSLLRHERIVTTTPKAKELKRIADKIITLGKTGTPHARRQAYRDVRDIEVLSKLFDVIGPLFKARPGGYTRIVKIGRRAGDNAETAMIELVDRTAAAAEGEEPKAEKKAKAPKAEKVAKAEKPEKAAKKAKAPKAQVTDKAPKGAKGAQRGQ